MAIKLVWMLEMKKVFCVLFSVAFLSVALAENQEVTTQEKNTGEIKVDKKELPKFVDIQSIYDNEYVQDEVRELQYRMLDLLKTINKSKQDKKEDLEKIKGSKKDIEQAKRRIDYLVSLESNLGKADTLERVKNVLGLNFSGKEEVQKTLDLIKAVEDADVFEKVRAIPRINQKINEVIDEYETLEKMVQTADSIEKIKKIPNIDPKSLAEIQELEKQIAEVKSLNDAKDIVNNSTISSNLKDQVARLINLEADFQNADNFDKLKKLPNINKGIVEYVDSQIAENQKLKQKLEQLQREKSDITRNMDKISTESEKERRFSTRLIGVILRALIGFDYRNARYDFEKSKELKIVEKSALVAASKDKLSYLGGTEKDLYTITNGLQNILKVLVEKKDWIKLAVPIKKKLENISRLCSKLNSDADIIKLNVGYAISLVSNLLEGAKRPPRDNVKNFDSVEEQKVVKK